MGRVKGWKYSYEQDGVVQVKLFSWKYFSDFVQHEMQGHNSFVWRGQRCDDWGLVTTLDRLQKDAKVSGRGRFSFRSKHFERFQQAVRGRRGPNPPAIQSEDEWWALGQHHGLATPLLDWTTSPFVAAYFAFIGQGENQTRKREIFALNKPMIESRVLSTYKAAMVAKGIRERESKDSEVVKNFKVASGLDRPILKEIEFINPLSDENHRLVNQGGCFTRSHVTSSIEDWVQENFAESDDRIMLKITIPNKDRDECLRELNRMNINHLTLFPDLFGASMHCNQFAKIKKY